jgi:hypothetical protein
MYKSRVLVRRPSLATAIVATPNVRAAPVRRFGGVGNYNINGALIALVIGGFVCGSLVTKGVIWISRRYSISVTVRKRSADGDAVKPEGDVK